MCDQPIAEATHDNTKHSQQTDIHAPKRIRAPSPNKRAAADPRLRPRGHRDRPIRFAYRTFWLTSGFKFNISCVSHLWSDVPIWNIYNTISLFCKVMHCFRIYYLIFLHLHKDLRISQKKKAQIWKEFFSVVQQVLTGILRDGVK